MKPRVMLIMFGIFVSLLSAIALIQGTSITGFATVSDTLTDKLNFPVSTTFYLFALLIIGIIAIVVGIKHRKVVY